MTRRKAEAREAASSRVVDQAGSWSGAPCWDLKFVPETPPRLDRLQDALSRDETVSLEVAATVAARIGPPPDRTPLVWTVDGLPPLGMVMWVSDWHGPASALNLSLPHRIARVCITPEFANGQEFVRGGPATRAFFKSFLGLARRLARQVPARQASLLLEGGSTEFADRAGIVLPAEVPAMLGLEPVGTRDGESLLAW